MKLTPRVGKKAKKPTMINNQPKITPNNERFLRTCSPPQSGHWLGISFRAAMAVS